MSALAQKQTSAAQKAMSALPPIATAKADFRKRSCLLYSQKQTCAAQNGMSALSESRQARLVVHQGIQSRGKASTIVYLCDYAETAWAPSNMAACRIRHVAEQTTAAGEHSQ